MMRKCYHDGQDPYIALLNLRNTPQQDSDYSSIQRLIGRRTQTLLPTVPGLLKPFHTNDYKIKKEFQQTKVAERFIARKELKPLQVRDSVMIQPIEPGKREWIPARVTGQVNPRSYVCVLYQTIFSHSLFNAETIKIKSKFSLICNLFSECKPMQVDLICVELINFVMYAFKFLVTLMETTLF